MIVHRVGTLDVGSTFDLIKRVWEHKNKVIPGFTAQYNVHMLVYYETHSTDVEAARREKRFKNWCRQWKINSIDELNPRARAPKFKFPTLFFYIHHKDRLFVFFEELKTWSQTLFLSNSEPDVA